MLWSASQPSPENIRIGVCADLDHPYGEGIWRGAVLAAEQVNAQGGLLGRNLTVIGEDDDSSSGADMAVGINALIKLITVDKADYILSLGAVSLLAYQDVFCEHRKIFFVMGVSREEYTQRVVDNYEKYKYSFRTYPANDTADSVGMLGGIIAVGNYTGFTKVALLFDDFPIGKALASNLNQSLTQHGFQVVYNTPYTFGTTDFTSYFAAIEASGAEILVPFILTQGGIAFVKDWYDRQSPFVVWGVVAMAASSNFWEVTNGRCDTVSFFGSAAVSGYPLTNKTVPTREAYFQRWGEVPTDLAVAAYDTVRFILPDAIKRAGTTETEALIKALEKTNVETSMARHFVFTSSHDVLVVFDSQNNPVEDYMMACMFQWQNGTQVPVYPRQIMEDSGSTYRFPYWMGPWSPMQKP